MQRVVGKFVPVCMPKACAKNPGFPEGYWLDFVCTKKSGLALPQPSSFWRREILAETGFLREKYHYVMDHELYTRLAHNEHVPICVGESLARFRVHKSQKSGQGFTLPLAEELAVVRTGKQSPKETIVKRCGDMVDGYKSIDFHTPILPSTLYSVSYVGHARMDTETNSMLGGSDRTWHKGLNTPPDK